MKKFTKILALVLAAMMILSFVACNNEEPKDDPKDDPCTEHVDADKNGKCDKCDATVEVTPPACTEHTDANTDGKCDTCGATVEVAPPACTEHVDADEDLKCDNCGADVAPAGPVDNPLIFNPTVSVLSSSDAVYDWGSEGISLDFTNSAIERIWTSDTDADVKAILEANEKFSDHVLKLKGKGTFDLPGLLASSEAALFTKGYTYSFEVTYYAKAVAGATYVIAYNGNGNREVKTSAFAAGENTLTFDYTVGENETGLTFFTTEDVEIYIGEISIRLFADGPSYGQLVEGYKFNVEGFKDIKNTDGTDMFNMIKVGDVADADQKAALIAAGLSEDTYVHYVTPGTEICRAFPFHASHYVVGTKYMVKVTYVNTLAQSKGSHFIALGTTNNTTHKSSVFATNSNLNTTEFKWQVSDVGEHTPVWFDSPEGLYIVGIEIKIDTAYDPHYVRQDYYRPTVEEMDAGVRYDFAEGNNPIAAGTQFVDINDENLGDTLSSVLTADKGFTSGYTYHVDGSIERFNAPAFCYRPGTTYRFTMRVYSEGSNFSGLLLLAFNRDNNQRNGHVNPTVTAVEGFENLYDITWDIPATEEVDYFACFVAGTVDEFYIAYVDIAPVPAAE